MRYVLVLVTCCTAAIAQPGPAARAWRQTHEHEIIREYVDLLSIPNIARDTANIRRNAAKIAGMLERRGVAPRVLEIEGAPPVVYGEIRTPGAARTVVFYAHYDGQPVDPAQWRNGDPFRPELRDAAGQPIPFPAAGTAFHPESRIYARSAGDDKGAVLAILTALDALRSAKIALKNNVKFFFEGEEEAGSPHLAEILRRNRGLLAADVWLFCDGPVHQSGRPQIVFGVRGVTGFDLTVYGPRRELHSGHYGNWAPNPAMMLAQLLASMKHADGRVLIKDFYEGVVPLSPAEREALAAIPNIDATLGRELWLGRIDGGGARLDELLNLPSLNIRGLASGAVSSQSRNVIPVSATASIDIRLVKGIDHEVAVRRVVEHVRRQGYFVTQAEPDAETRMKYPKVARIAVEAGGYNAARTSMDLEISRRVVAAVEAARGPVVKLPTAGGSLPLAVLEEVLRVPMIMMPIANYDNNQHSHNENMRLRNLWEGIETMAALLAME